MITMKETLGYQVNNNIRLETYFNYADTFLEYDSVNLTSD